MIGYVGAWVVVLSIVAYTLLAALLWYAGPRATPSQYSRLASRVGGWIGFVWWSFFAGVALMVVSQFFSI